MQTKSLESDEDEVDLALEDLVYTQQTPKSSLIFSLIRYPLLLICVWIIVFHLCIYLTLKQFIALLDYFSSFWTVRQKLKEKLQRSESYEDYLQTALLLDEEYELNKQNSGIADEQLYDEGLVEKTTRRLFKARVRDRDEILVSEILQSACNNNLDRVDTKRLLHKRTFAGASKSKEDYSTEVSLALEFAGSSDKITHDEKTKLFNKLSMLFGKTTLYLSGGALLGCYHFGVTKALFENNILPNIITGSSAGSLIAAIVGTRNNEELSCLFNDPAVPDKLNLMMMNMFGFLKTLFTAGIPPTSKSEVSNFGLWLTKGQTTFLEAYQHSGRCLNIFAMPNEADSKFKVLNYITAPHVTIFSALVSSFAFPYAPSPARLFQKDSRGNIISFKELGKTWKVGFNNIPLRDLQMYFKVKYTIISQTDPHISLFPFSIRRHIGSNTVSSYRAGFLVAAIMRYTLLEILKWLR
jgi:predicted acylesterase/phospholipase RssA